MMHIWLENLGESKTEYRGKVQHVLSGEVRYFHDWSMLENHLLDILNDSKLNRG